MPGRRSAGKYYLKGTKPKTQEFDGFIFKSENERRYYQTDLKPDPDVEVLTNQPKFLLQPAFVHNGVKILAIRYTADFLVLFRGQVWIIEVKNEVNIKDAAYQIRKRLFLRLHPDYRFKEVIYSGRKIKKIVNY